MGDLSNVIKIPLFLFGKCINEDLVIPPARD